MLKVSLTGDGTIDNAVIYLEDPKEKMPYFLQPTSETDWERDDLSIPLDGELNYSLYVLAFNGTGFKCVVTNKDDNKTVTIKGVTGKIIKSQAHETGAQFFQ